MQMHRARLLKAQARKSPKQIHVLFGAEFCARGSMYQLLHAPSVHLSWRQIYFMCAGVAKGMAHLHSQNILHRDLKSGVSKH
jgi:serine/threonine protein kinase